MKRSCLALLLVALAASAVEAAPTRVQFISAHDQSSVIATVVTSQVTVTNGNVLVGVAQWPSSTITFTSITRTGGTDTGTIGSVTTFTDFATSAVSQTSFWIPITGSGTITLTLTLSGNVNKNLMMWEMSGVDTTTPINAHGGQRVSLDSNGADDLTDGVSSGNITTTVNGCLILGFFSANSQTLSPGTGFTSHTNGNANTWGVTAEYGSSVQAVAGVTAATWTRTAGGATAAAVGAIAVAPSGAAAATCTGQLSLMGVGCEPPPRRP